MTGSGTNFSPINADSACRALAATERRAILNYLLSTDAGAADFEALARYVELQQNGDTEADTDSLGMVILELIHQHLPHLEAAGLIDFDSRTETVVATNAVESLRPILDALETL